MIYKPEHGDLVRILPILKKDGNTIPYLATSFLYESGKMIFDRHSVIEKLWAIERKREEGNTSGLGRRCWMFVEVGGEYKFMYAGASIMKVAQVILEDPFSEKVLSISKKTVSTGEFSAKFPSYEDSKIEVSEWNPPAEEDRKEWLKEKQPFYIEEWIDQRGVFDNMEFLRKRFGESLAQMMADEREKKLGELGI